MTHYQQGDYAEKLVMATLVTNGYLCWQTRGSKGLADIIAVKPVSRARALDDGRRIDGFASVLLVQVKRGTVAAHLDWNALYELATAYCCRPVWVDTYEPGAGSRPATFRWREITGWHSARGRDWPAVPFVIDTVIEHEPHS